MVLSYVRRGDEPFRKAIPFCDGRNTSFDHRLMGREVTCMYEKPILMDLESVVAVDAGDCDTGGGGEEPN